ncbi:MAG: GNAT family N-acetyltransferase [Armatimonadota bacterium]
MSEEYRAIRLDELDECLDLWSKAFPHTPREYFEPYFNGDPGFRPEYTRVCVLDNKLVSAIQICERKVRIGSSVIVMGGIGNVGTDPDFRGKGYSTRLLQDCVHTMYDSRIDFSTLFTGINPFYERVVWRTVPIELMTGQIMIDTTLSSAKYTVRPCNWENALQSLINIYDNYNRSRTLTAVRSPEYWTGWAVHRFGGGSSLYVAEYNGTIVGYIQCHHDNQNCWIREIGCLDQHRDCIDILIKYAAGIAYEVGARTLWNFLPDEPDIIQSIDTITDNMEIRQTTGTMCRIVNAESMLGRILPELNLCAQGMNLPDCAVNLDTECGGLTFTINKGIIHKGAENPVTINLSQSDFFSLIFGYKCIDATGIQLSPELKVVISTLFPKQHPASWAADHF